MRFLPVTLLFVLGGCSTAAADTPQPQFVENSIGMRFVEITTPDSDFHLGVHEVTQAAFQRVMKRNPSCFASAGELRDRVKGLDTGRLPVDSVNWHDAVEFCRRLSALAEERAAGRSYRLPTESEWEFAARAGSDDHWFFGNDRRQLDQFAWYGFDKADRRTHKVGGKKPNPFGLFDIYGNVWEWCQDPYLGDDNASVASNQTNSRVIRGGGWYSRPQRCSSGYRTGDPAKIGDEDTGFRVVLEM